MQDGCLEKRRNLQMAFILEPLSIELFIKFVLCVLFQTFCWSKIYFAPRSFFFLSCPKLHTKLKWVFAWKNFVILILLYIFKAKETQYQRMPFHFKINDLVQLHFVEFHGARKIWLYCKGLRPKLFQWYGKVLISVILEILDLFSYKWVYEAILTALKVTRYETSA